MPRQPRYFIPGLPQHVIQRGVDRQAVFFEDSDYQLYRKSLGTAARQFDCQIHAYVLMTNHTHLLITPGSERSLPHLMQALGRTYVQRVNRQYNRTGTLWQGRYKASLVQDNAYLLSCYRYIELNPVRAGMVRLPGDYPHSSYAHNAVGKYDSLITEHARYQSLATNLESRFEAYRNLFADEFDPELLTYIRDTTNACRVMGNNRFKDQIEAMLGRSVRPAKMGRPGKRSS
ncbi:MAG: transposase [Gammaproteobacteria bacterium]|nr:transposase [Gammaproteobacteria bacterium]NNF61506.1 transposase [Gammaproteobacteria bacterium]